MNPVAGWYYAEGDPPGTVRRWNGTAWIGFPTRPPSEPVGPDTPGAVAVKPFVHHAGQVKLRYLGWLAKVTLVGTAMLLASLAVLTLWGAQDTGITEPADNADEVPMLVVIILVIALFLAGFCPPVFILWFATAYRNISLWSSARRSVAWAVFAWITPLVAYIRPMSMTLELIEKSPRDDREGELSPVPVIVWWFLWHLPFFVVVLVSIRVTRAVIAVLRGSWDPTTFDLPFSVTNMFVASLFLNAIAALIAVYLVHIISKAQDARLRPTPAQHELWLRERERTAHQRADHQGALHTHQHFGPAEAEALAAAQNGQASPDA